jgi:hypothetical protein
MMRRPKENKMSKLAKLAKKGAVKRVQTWFWNRPPTEIENISVNNADIILVTFPVTLQDWVHRQRASGIKVLPYVSFYKTPELAKLQEEKERFDWGNPSRQECIQNPFWRAVATDNHPEWRARDEKGDIRQPFGHYDAGWSMSTPLVKSYRDACLQGIEALMKSGCDGIFLDNFFLQGNPAHHGLGSGAEVDQAIRSLTIEAAEIIHNYKPNAILCTNGSDDVIKHDKEMKSVIDFYASESMIFSWAWDLSFLYTGWPAQWAHYQSHAWHAGEGPQPVVIPYLGFSGRALREDAYTVMAAAWILGMAFSDGGTAANLSGVAGFAKRHKSFQGGAQTALLFQADNEHDKWLEDFYRLDLGEPIGEGQEIQACLLRHFEKGVCLFNPTPELKQITVKNWSGTTAYEHACGVNVDVRSGEVPVWLPPLTGRVLTHGKNNE